ncbi:SSS family transporter [Anseongella ginsenosidimutans]|uniref:SSS family transporter n=1 Tax=Anseongella ginsenosidimutans TaxID=496056 RepID=A0A4V2UTG0_9SPHI|nr:sodium/solute symporter [Anseongella ginsenosidimutans]QEC52384.1 sodium/solute symporter [Anseongella ginsenosidimutans]TCS85875.1 SSS family transporter [Anseongella ginsenosidimutans]
MQLLDYCVLAGYFLVIFLIGSFFSTSQKSLKDYFLGSRNIPWWAVSFSGIATVISAISYIGAVGLGFSSDFGFLQYRLAIPIAILVIVVIILPFFYNLQLYSIYEYLEKRFNLTIRLLGSGIFILFKCCYLALAIFAPAIVIEVLTGINLIWIVLITGAVTTLYTLLGGIKSVIWTDALQLVILLGGIFLVIGISVEGVDGGLSGVLDTGKEFDKFRYLRPSLSLTETYTIWNGLIGGAFLMISQFGTDQTEMQRFLTTRSLKKANIALASSLLIAALMGFLIFFEGAAIFAFYEQRGQAGIEPNQVLVKFIVEELPTGVKGFLLAGILAAAMSTISSVLNSLTTVSLSDFYNRFKKREASVSLARMVTLGFGLLATFLACFGNYFGNILETAMTVINFFGGGLVGLFLLGMLSRKATPGGAMAGFIAGFVVILPVAAFTDVAYMWYSAITAICTYVVGLLVSRLSGTKPLPGQEALVYSRHKKK